jgi:DNA-directed RNA polymerase subunit RPC12/RpoP
MGSLQAYRCKRCRTEVVAATRSAGHPASGPRSPQLLCCGEPLKSLAIDSVQGGEIPKRRFARCPRCGYRVQLVMQPLGPLVCLPCQMEMIVLVEHAGQEERKWWGGGRDGDERSSLEEQGQAVWPPC